MQILTTITDQEKEKVLTNYFKQGIEGKLYTFPSKEKRKLIILEAIIKHFDADQRYTEKEVNQILKPVHRDFALIRRALIDYRFMDRSEDCREYWVMERGM